jgi:hypothetical protein
MNQPHGTYSAIAHVDNRPPIRTGTGGDGAGWDLFRT